MHDMPPLSDNPIVEEAKRKVAAGEVNVGDVLNGIGALVEGAPVAVDAVASAGEVLGGAMEGLGSGFEVAGGCLEGLSGCSMVLAIVVLTATAGAALAFGPF